MASLQATKAPASPLWRGSLVQLLRISSGLVLFTFIFFHFLNHSLGIWSIEAMDSMQVWRTAITRSVPGTIVLAAALVTHMGLNLYKIAGRSTWRMPWWEAVQIGLGLLIPVLLARHAAPMRAHFDLEGSATRYSETLGPLWTDLWLNQFALLLIVWTHACFGLHYWLRLGRHYRRIAPLLLAVAVLVPTLALSGFVVAGREAAVRAAAQAAAKSSVELDEYGNPMPASLAGAAAYDSYDEYGSAAPAPAAKLTAADVQGYFVWTAWTLLGLVAAALAARVLLGRRTARVRISYIAGPTVQSPIGPTLLEVSRRFGVPHTSVCGGRARCSTCRVQIDDAAGPLPAMNAAEAATLARIGAGPNVRLACQLRPNGHLVVTRLVRPPDERRPVSLSGTEDAGVERVLAILFLDIRGFTTISEARLPFDTVFLLNRFFAEIGEATNAAGGWIDKYLGDGMLALFGVNRPVEEACRSALSAAMMIDAALERLNRELSAELTAPLRIGIGLHVGPLILGRIGHRSSASTTVIGPAVNVASRLEALTKEHSVQTIASAELVATAGLPHDAFPRVGVTVRGTSTEIPVHLIKRGRDLEPYLGRKDRLSAA
jgi:adenylate cyclase